MHVAITGSSGLVGGELVSLLKTEGHSVTRIVRGMAGEGEVAWHPDREEFDSAPLEGVDAVVHLAGENIAGGRWNKARKQRMRDSRIVGTRLLCEGLAKMKAPPKTLVAASAIGIYGSRGEEVLDESSSTGEGFLPVLCQDWEAAAKAAVDVGMRVVNIRIGLVLSPKGGALTKMLLPFKLGGGGIVGSGKQWWSWISLDDTVGAIHHAIVTESLRGPVNLVAPNSVTNREFTKTLGRVLKRPTIVPLPAFFLRLALGEMAHELLLASDHVKPRALVASGYEFQHPELEVALRHVLGK